MFRGLSVGGCRLVAFALATLALAACATPGAKPDGAANAHYKIGKPYQVNGRWYHPHEQPDYDAVGVASWYGDEFHGRPTANGERFDKDRLSAAHTTLPLPSVVEVENLENGRRVMVRVNDRGPFVGDRMIDLSHAAARVLGFEQKGLARVRVRYLGRAELAALAPRPGEKAIPLKTAAPRVATREPAPAVRSVQAAPLPAAVALREAPAPNSTPDIIAQLIGEADSVTAKGSSPPAYPAAPEPEIWIDVKQFSNLADLDMAQVSVAAMGPARVRSTILAAGQPAYLLQLGPYKDTFAAEARLAALREAGYAEARISNGSL